MVNWLLAIVNNLYSLYAIKDYDIVAVRHKLFSKENMKHLLIANESTKQASRSVTTNTCCYVHVIQAGTTWNCF